MIFTGLKLKSNQIFFNKNVTKLLENSVKNSSKKIENTIVFVDDFSEKDRIQKSLKNNLNFSDAAIDFIVFQPAISKENVDKDIFSPKDFGLYGKINSEKLKNSLTKKYDLLINYSKIENVYSNILLLQCKAEFRAGFKHLDNRFYDLLIDCELTDIEVFNKELKKYLTILNKL